MKEVVEFENLIKDYFGSKFAIATDCCTHAIELCLRYLDIKKAYCPANTYLSVPMTFAKLGIDWHFKNYNWKDYYYIGNTNIIDAAVYWKQNGYIKETFMCLSFQYKKHLKLGRGGMILLDDPIAFDILSKMRYDGRQNNIPWAQQDIDILGYHYYMTPETAMLGSKLFDEIKDIPPQQWSSEDYPDLTKMKVFADAKSE